MLSGVFLIVSAMLFGSGASDSAACLSPVSLVASPRTQRLYVAETTSRAVAVFDTAAEKVVQTILVGDRPTGLALGPKGRTLFVTNAVPEGIVRVVDLERTKVIDRIAVGHTPMTVHVSPDGKTLYVCNRFTHDVSVVDLEQGKEMTRIAVAREPVAAALTANGKFLFVANHLPFGPATADHVASVVSIIDTSAGKVTKTLDLPNGSVNLRGIALSPDNRYAYVTHTLARYQFPVAKMEAGWINTNAMTVLDVRSQAYLNTFLLDDPHAGAADPHGVTCTPDGKSLLVTHAGSHELSVINRQAIHYHITPAKSAKGFRSSSGSQLDKVLSDRLTPAQNLPNDVSFLSGLRRRVKLPGRGPRAVVTVGSTVYVSEYFSDSLAAVRLHRRQLKARAIRLGPVRPETDRRRGERLFHDAAGSFETWHSCASCHTGDARTSALNWDLLNDGVANAKNIKSLLLTYETPPVMSTGVRPHADSAVWSGIRYVQFAFASQHTMEAMRAYLKSLTPVPSPRLVKGRLSDSAKKGEVLFRSIGCVNCHAGPYYTDMKKHDVGTQSAADEAPDFDVPSLIEVWRTAPYLHDGRAKTVKEVLTTFNAEDRHARTSHLGDKELSCLVEYVLTR